MDQEAVLEQLFDKKIIAIVRLLLSNKDRDFYLQDIAKQAKVPLASTHRIVSKLKGLGIIDEVHVKKVKLYRCSNNEITQFLESFILLGKRVLEKFCEQAGNIIGISEIILYGDEMENRANILIIGQGVNHEDIKILTAQFKEKYNYAITQLILAREQFDQMINMGLYSGSKKVLFRR